MAVTAVEGEKR